MHAVGCQHLVGIVINAFTYIMPCFYKLVNIKLSVVVVYSDRVSFVNKVFTDRILYKLKMCKNSNHNIIYVQEQYIFSEYTELHSAQRNGPLRNSVTRFFASGFFHESVSPQPQSIP